MSKFAVTVRAKMTKTFLVEAEDEDTAMVRANELFDINEDISPSKYEQFVLNVLEV